MIKLTTIHRDWIVDMTPVAVHDGFSASVWVQREAGEGENQGDSFMFSDLGRFATQGEAACRGETWAIRWLDENDY